MNQRDDTAPAASGNGLERDVTPSDDGSREDATAAIDLAPDDPDAATPPAGGEQPPPAADLPPAEALARAAEALRTLRLERDRLYDAWLRSSADFENYRKRTEREREEFRHYAVESLVLQVLPVLDNFERAIESLPPGAARGFADGVQLIYRQLADVLAKQGVTPIPAVGEPFDPHLHEAVETEPRSDVPHHQVLCERAKGYWLGKRVLRPARVKVSVRPGSEPEETLADSSEGTS